MYVHIVQSIRSIRERYIMNRGIFFQRMKKIRSGFSFLYTWIFIEICFFRLIFLFILYFRDGESIYMWTLRDKRQHHYIGCSCMHIICTVIHIGEQWLGYMVIAISLIIDNDR